MTIEVIRCETKKQFRDFLQVPFELHQQDPNWVPPLRMTTKQILNKKNPFFRDAQMALWTAYHNKKLVGRIAGIKNALHNQYHQENIAFWGFFETVPDENVSKALFKEVELWAIQQGVTGLRGPMNPSVNYDCGLQISAFDTKPFIMMPQNPDYYPSFVENQGYTKIKDLEAWAWMMTIEELARNERKIRYISSLQEKHQVTLRKINLKKFDEEIKLFVDVYNDALNENWGYLPLSADEFSYLSRQFKALAVADLIYFAEIDNEVCAFMVGFPDFNQLFISIRQGKLWPHHLLKFLWQLKIKKAINQFRLPLLGVRKKYNHLPIAGMFYAEYLQNALRLGMKQCELAWILEDNKATRSGLKFLGAKLYKTYRIYQKNFAEIA